MATHLPRISGMPTTDVILQQARFITPRLRRLFAAGSVILPSIGAQAQYWHSQEITAPAGWVWANSARYGLTDDEQVVGNLAPVSDPGNAYKYVLWREGAFDFYVGVADAPLAPDGSRLVSISGITRRGVAFGFSGPSFRSAAYWPGPDTPVSVIDPSLPGPDRRWGVFVFAFSDRLVGWTAALSGGLPRRFDHGALGSTYLELNTACPTCPGAQGVANQFGDVAGGTNDQSGTYSLRWDDAGSVSHVGPLGSWGYAINDAGQWVEVRSTGLFLWTAGVDQQIGPAIPHATAAWLNERGQVLAKSGSSFLWDNGVSRPFTSLLDPSEGWSPQLAALVPLGLNRDGWILFSGLRQGDPSGMGVRLAILRPPLCYPNCDGSTLAPVLNVNDFICFQNKFAGGDSYANCDGSTTPPVLNVNDFICFQSLFAAGCQ